MSTQTIPRPKAKHKTRRTLLKETLAYVQARIAIEGWHPPFQTIGGYASDSGPHSGLLLMDALREETRISVSVWETRPGRTVEDVRLLLERVQGRL